ncbi:hypothetical protein [Streptomyces sp. NPDC058486]|uniref:hypothetical protein n=1 Tax=unclassified Streptomyces TaxID=2593676 RepID=UPI0036468668
MSSASSTDHSIDATTSALQRELPLLEQLQQDLKRQLDAVSERVITVRTALTALLALAETPVPPAPHTRRDVADRAVATTGSGAVPAARRATEPPTGEREAASVTGGRKERASVKKPRAIATATAQRTASAAQEPGSLTEQVLAVLSRSQGSPMRARDVAQALGRDSSTGAVNTVRSTLDRLVAGSRAARAGRGLYQTSVD